jgi:hypothetical protein
MKFHAAARFFEKAVISTLHRRLLTHYGAITSTTHPKEYLLNITAFLSFFLWHGGAFRKNAVSPVSFPGPCGGVINSQNRILMDVRWKG